MLFSCRYQTHEQKASFIKQCETREEAEELIADHMRFIRSQSTVLKFEIVEIRA